VTPLMVSTASRASDLPDVPAPADIGLPNAVTTVWYAVFMPAKTPRDIVEKFHAVGMKVLATPEMQAKMKKLAVDPMPMTTAEMDKFVAAELANNGKLIKAAGIAPK
jgi:tripartite-type tricarboxylate transporter receptor subunit TctC